MEPVERHDSTTLLTVAAAAGTTVSARQLELWRYRGLLPRPERQGRGRSWLYPPGTDRQLLRLLHWRRQARSLDLIRVALWAEGFPVEPQGVRDALRTFVETWSRELIREQRHARRDDTQAFIDALAHRLAAMRSRAPVPRVVRMTASERQRAHGYLLALMFGFEDEVQRRAADLPLVERMLGLRSGRGRPLAATIPLDDDLRRLARLPPPEELSRIVAAATDDELEFVRRLIQFMVAWTPLLLPLLSSDQGPKSAPLLALARELFTDIPIGFYPLLTTLVLVSVHSKHAVPEELRRNMTSLEPGTIDIDLLSQLPAGASRSAFERLPERRRERVSELVRERKRVERSA